MSDSAAACIAAVGFSVLIGLIEIRHRSGVRFRYLIPDSGFLTYLLILVIGNVVATLCATSVPAPSPDMPRWFWSAFVGVFAFEMIIQRLNVTFNGDGFLTVSDWINKARDSAVADAVVGANDRCEQDAQALARKLAAFTGPLLDTHVVSILGQSALDQMNAQIAAGNLDDGLYKGLALASGNYGKAQQIVNPTPG